MNEKPKFGDVFWASHVGDSYLIIRDRKNKTETVYYRTDGKKGTAAVFMVVITLILLVSFFIIDSFKIWNNLEYDLYIIVSLMAFVLIILILKYQYKSATLEEIHGEELQEVLKEKKKFIRLRRVIFIAFYVVIYGFLFMNSYSVTYLKYLAEGGPNISTVQVSINIRDNNIQLNDATEETRFKISGVSAEEEAVIQVIASKMPDDLSLFLNGQEIKSLPWMYDNFIWEDEYFRSETNFYTTIGEFIGINTLEIKEGGFHKVSTFRIEAGQ